MFKDLIEDRESEEDNNTEEQIVQFPSGYIIFTKNKAKYSNKLDEKYRKILEGDLRKREHYYYL